MKPLPPGPIGRSSKPEIIEVDGQKISKLDLLDSDGKRVSYEGRFSAANSIPKNAQEFKQNTVKVILERAEELTQAARVNPGEPILIAEVQGLPPGGLQQQDICESTIAMHYDLGDLVYDPDLLKKGIILTINNRFRFPLEERLSKEDIRNFGKSIKHHIAYIEECKGISIPLPQIMRPYYLAIEAESYYDPSEIAEAVRRKSGEVSYSTYSHVNKKFYLRPIELTEEELKEFSLAVQGPVVRVREFFRNLIGKLGL